MAGEELTAGRGALGGWKLRHFGIALALILVPALSVTMAQAATDRTYACGDGAGTVVVSIVTPNQVKVTVDFPGSDDGKMTLTMDGGGDVQSGFQFTDGEYEIAITGAGKEKLTYMAPDFGSIDCTWKSSTADTASPVLQINPKLTVKVAPKATVDVTPKRTVQVAIPKMSVDVAVPAPETGTTAQFPAEGRSCGGIMRKGPSMDTAKVASLKAGAEISILEQTGPIDEQGYAWFKIKTGGKTGYQWGGILSVAKGKLSGAFVGC